MMAKYTMTSMDFFLKLRWREGMQYYLDISLIVQEEQEQYQASQPKGVPVGLDQIRGGYR
jgi:uncharacterized protein (DUF1919 family)